MWRGPSWFWNALLQRGLLGSHSVIRVWGGAPGENFFALTSALNKNSKFLISPRCFYPLFVLVVFTCILWILWFVFLCF